MTFTMFVMWVLVGLLAGLLAGLVMKRGGYGLKKDILFGVGGSIALSWLLRGLGIITGTGMVVAAVGGGLRGGHPRVSARTGRTSGGGGGSAPASWLWWPG